MNKLLNNITSNKNFKRWLGIILAIALVATMFPYMSAAYGNNDKPAQQDEPALVEAGDNTIISEEDSDGDGSEESVEGEDPQSGDDGIAVVTEEQTESTNGPSKAAARAVNYNNNANALNAALQSGNVGTKDNPVSISFTSGNPTVTIPSGKTIFGTISVGANTTLTLLGTGTINGCQKGSVITVEGKNAKLVVGDTNSGPTITGGTGGKLTLNPTSGNDQIFFG